MTRINVGIPPHELSDQHLLGEHHELPRMVAFAHLRANRNTIPSDLLAFCLNTGHMVSCVRYGEYLAFRHQQLVAEMQWRGFEPGRPAVQVSDFPRAARHTPAQHWLDAAVPLSRARIIERLRTMKRTPVWTKRQRPAWACT
jgi:hypothetical protein